MEADAESHSQTLGVQLTRGRRDCTSNARVKIMMGGGKGNHRGSWPELSLRDFGLTDREPVRD